ncbi:FlgD immunoglobulin-like domain containing protein, partial [Candidatus Poribacteria bacterium]
ENCIAEMRYKRDKAGCAYIFRRDNASWVEQAKLAASDGAEDDRFGTSVHISGNYAIVGSCRDDDKGALSGSAYIYHNDGTSWTEQAKLTADDGKASSYFGLSVYISEDYAIVGATMAGGGGTIYVFTRDGFSWDQVSKQKASDGLPGDMFGCSIAASDDYVIVGANQSDNEAFDSGSAYIYQCADLLLPKVSVQPSGAAIATFGSAKNRYDIAQAIAGPSAEAVQSMPINFSLLQNYPNPFNPETWIPYQLGRDSDVAIKIHTPSGQLVRTLKLGDRSAGLYTEKTEAAHWDGTNDSGEPVAAGVYFYTIQTDDNYAATKKMVVVR